MTVVSTFLCEVVNVGSLYQTCREWKYAVSSIKSMSVNKRDERGLLLYVIDKFGEDFQMFFPSGELCKK